MPVCIAVNVVVGIFSAVESFALECEVSASPWVNGYTTYVDITNNTQQAVNAWEVGLEFDESVGVYGFWNTQLSATEKWFRAKSLSYNANLAPGETASFGIVGSHNGSFSSPTCHTPQDLIIQETETGFCSVAGSIDANHAGYAGVGFSNTDNVIGSQIIWRVSAQLPGDYTVKLRYANGSGSSRGGDIYVNNVKQNSPVGFSPTGAWSNWLSEAITVNLNAGENAIILEATTASGLANVDSLTLNGIALSAVDCLPKGEDGYLPQAGNPAQSRFNRARTAWSPDLADTILSYQFDNGGWPKNQDYSVPGNGGTGEDEATFDNGATVTELVYLAQMYQNTGNSQYLDAVQKAMDYILTAQYTTGGWPQFYPLRGGYSDYVTFNDNAMSQILMVLHNAVQQNEPFQNSLFSEAKREQMQTAIANATNYILQAQWRQDGELTVWCAQHGVEDYLPKPARAYELESLSGSESVEIVGFLMSQQQTPEIKAAVDAALAWFRSPSTILENYVYDRSTTEKIVYQEGGRMWYRFYDLDTNQGFFSDRDGGKYDDIMDISEERREGYSWGGNYGERLINYANTVGY